MGLKQLFQKYLGVNTTNRLISIKKNIELLNVRAKGNYGKIEFEGKRDYYLFSKKDSNIFFGYYDIQQYNNDGTKLLAHIVKKNANPAYDKAELGWFDESEKSWHSLTETAAWSWQQGSRLRWHPENQNVIVYNDLENDIYVTKTCDILTGEIKTVCRALYDVDTTFSHGLSLNFARLQRVCPGYGYSVLKDGTKGERAPLNDGVFYVDVRSGKEKLLFSLAELAKDIDEAGEHYINHLSVAPDGKRFTFFHLWRVALNPWKIRFYSAEMTGENLICLEEDIRVSHYCWINNQEMLVTACEGKYFCYNVYTGAKKEIQSEHLKQDGHPSILKNGFLTDTYPSKSTALQYVFRIDYSGKNYRRILKIFGDPRCFAEHRCDLHPRVMPDGKVSIDTTCLGKVRSILTFSLKEDEM